MKHRLLWLNICLLVLVIVAGAALRQRFQEGKKREEAMRSERVRNAPAPSVAPIQPAKPAKPQEYIEVAEKMLFSRDRNPTVILDPPPPPPPPKPMPSLPVAYGVMDLGAGPMAILAPGSGGPHKSYRQGEMIGEFKIVSITNRELVFDWEGKEIKRTLEELKDKSAPAVAEAKAPAPLPAQPPAPAKPGPGAETGGGFRACNASDPSPAGAVVDGMRKVMVETPFGKSCRWEPAK